MEKRDRQIDSHAYVYLWQVKVTGSVFIPAHVPDELVERCVAAGARVLREMDALEGLDRLGVLFGVGRKLDDVDIMDAMDTMDLGRWPELGSVRIQ